MRRLSRKNRFREEPNVNLTPLIDVVFSILIVFIVVAPLLEVDRVELASGRLMGKQTSVQDQEPISIHVYHDNKIVFNQQVVEIPQLGQLFRTEKGRYPNAKPQVFHDRRAAFGVYQEIKNAAESAGFHEMDIILNPI